ncbi:SdpI/YhfL protein family protein [Singulisphaera sp. GP187]|uniref:SdpI family protein n=1 Tax=Singulisphaera sp. GP187 TaxID=1882752 RepID=UPI0009294E1C|nr:SdpI family protein [Singulisphaera sp. GP187]SIO65978.1 SdpI/YhfL protein family protein [Singulisphaera sp. GP187]
MTFILITNVAAGLLVTAIARPLIHRRIAPNALYGFRVRRTLENPEVWYDANEYAGRCLFWFGIGTSLAALALFFLPGIDPVAYAVSCLIITLIGLTVGVALSFRHLNNLPHQ